MQLGLKRSTGVPTELSETEMDVSLAFVVFGLFASAVYLGCYFVQTTFLGRPFGVAGDVAKCANLGNLFWPEPETAGLF